jgi:hypothetical protein
LFVVVGYSIPLIYVPFVRCLRLLPGFFVPGFVRLLLFVTLLLLLVGALFRVLVEQLSLPLYLVVVCSLFTYALLLLPHLRSFGLRLFVYRSLRWFRTLLRLRCVFGLRVVVVVPIRCC